MKVCSKERLKISGFCFAEIVDCKPGGLKPSDKMTRSRAKSFVVTSSHVAAVCGNKRISASVDRSSGGRRQIRHVASREHSVVT